MDDDLQNLLSCAAKLIAFLETIVGEDQNRAREAAEIIRNDMSAPKPELMLTYTLGGKGIHDWRWSDENRKIIEKITWNTYAN